MIMHLTLTKLDVSTNVDKQNTAISSQQTSIITTSSQKMHKQLCTTWRTATAARINFEMCPVVALDMSQTTK